ncbi:MAG: transposase [Candidatus Altiarchaeota archaeon]|nr:transposase [Candidatus Altiarchaeota archaeon]
MEAREIRGIQIAEKGGLEQTKHGWIVPAQWGSGHYFVQRKGGRYVCDCPDCQTRNLTCKHTYAVMHTIQKTTDTQGNTTVTETKKVTYSQNWKAYNKAQTGEITSFDELLKDLVENVEEPIRDPSLIGRKPLTLRDGLFCSIQKVYSQLSSRRAYTLYKNASQKEQLNKVPNFNAINKFLNREEITPLLHQLLTLTALPLKSVETTFAPDSSGFRTTQFNQYCVEKHGTKKQHHWVKAHILVGTKTNVIASAQITPENGADCLQFNPLLTEAYNGGFTIKEVVADKAYTSRENYNLVNELGATAYLPFKSKDGGKSRGSVTWKRMYHYFMLNRDEFMQHYHQRSNVESAFNMIKAKFGDKLKSKNYKAQENEMLCKLIAHNICVLIQEMHELKIKPDFKPDL